MKTPRRITLDPAAPLRSLREGADLTQQEVAAARGIAQGSVSLAESAGAGTSVRTLVATAEALGYRVRLVALKEPRCVSPNHRRGAPTVDPWTCQCGRVCCAECEGGTEDHLCDVCHAKASTSKATPAAPQPATTPPARG